jgi:hypothetical protein
MADDIVTRLREERDKYRLLCDRMYLEIVKDWCWHCGAEMTRNCYTSNLMDEYRDAVIESGSRSD